MVNLFTTTNFNLKNDEREHVLANDLSIYDNELLRFFFVSLKSANFRLLTHLRLLGFYSSSPHSPFSLGRSHNQLLVACLYLGVSCTAVHLIVRREEVDIQHKTARKILSSLSKWLPIKQPEFTAREIVFIIRQCEQHSRYMLCHPVI